MTVVAASSRKAGLLNVRGAYPLLLIGAALVAYGVLVSIQTPAATVGRFEIWPLLVVLGATVIGAGIFSLYFAIDESLPESTAGARNERDERPSDAHPASGVKASGSASPVATPPPWWEGLPDSSSSKRRPAAPEALGAPRSSSASSELHLPSSRPTGLPAASTPTIPPTEPPDDVASTLKELEAISLEISSIVPASSKPSAPRTRTTRCSDCGQTIPHDATLICEECGNCLCANCASETALSTGVVTCRACRVRTELDIRGKRRGVPQAGGASRVRPND